MARSGQVQEYYERCATGTLPALSFVDPAFDGEDSGTSGDEHPHGDVRIGPGVHGRRGPRVHRESPQFKRGALFIVYDEWGGFFDHVRPPRVPDAALTADLDEDFGQMGFRIPAVAVSPYARRGHVDHTIYGFESILKMIRYRFGLPPLTTRDAYARNIARSFDFVSKPRLDVPDLPPRRTCMSAACAVPAPALPNPGGEPQARRRRRPQRPKPHDLAVLRTSGYLERLGLQLPAGHRRHHLPPALGNPWGCAHEADRPRGRRRPGRRGPGPRPGRSRRRTSRSPSTVRAPAVRRRRRRTSR